MFGTFVYAANGGSERRELWKNLEIYKRIVGMEAWMLMGDLNVTLNTNEHSQGCSYMTNDRMSLRSVLILLRWKILQALDCSILGLRTFTRLKLVTKVQY